MRSTSGSPASSLSAPASRSASRRLLTNSSVDWCVANQLQQPGMDGRPDRRRASGRRSRLGTSSAETARHVLDRNVDPQLQLFFPRHR